jgi:hypothetical protein
MVQLIGTAAILLVAGLPIIAQPGLPLLAVGSAVGLICAGGLLLPSLGLAITGVVAGLLAFSATLLMAPTENAVPQAVAMGIGLLVLIDLTHFRRCSARADIGVGVTLAHLTNLAISIMISVGAAALLIAMAVATPLDLEPAVRPLVAAAGGILILAAILRVLTKARRQQTGPPAGFAQDKSDPRDSRT